MARGRYWKCKPTASHPPKEVYDEFLKLREEFTGENSAIFIGLQDELPCALIQRWQEDSSPALLWARDYLIETTAQKPDNDTWVRRRPIAHAPRSFAISDMSSPTSICGMAG
jgi:hypothetical protein